MARTYQVIDADGHILEPLDLWDRYMDPAYRERAPRLIIGDNGKERLLVEGKILGNPKGLGRLGAVGARDGSVPADTMMLVAATTDAEATWPDVAGVRAAREVHADPGRGGRRQRLGGGARREKLDGVRGVAVGIHGRFSFGKMSAPDFCVPRSARGEDDGAGPGRPWAWRWPSTTPSW